MKESCSVHSGKEQISMAEKRRSKNIVNTKILRAEEIWLQQRLSKTPMIEQTMSRAR